MFLKNYFIESVRYMESVLFIPVSLLTVLSLSITVLSDLVVSVFSLLHANKNVIKNRKINFFIAQIFIVSKNINYIANLV